MIIREPEEEKSKRIGTELLSPFYEEEERLDPDFNRLDITDDPDADWWITDEDRGIFVAVIENELVGVITLGQTPSPPIYERGKIAYLDGLYIKPEHRREGVATSLLNRGEEWAESQGCEYIRTWVHTNNAEAIRLYETAFSLKYHSFWKGLADRSAE